MPDNSLTPVDVDLSDVSAFESAPKDIYEWTVVDVRNQRPGKAAGSICWTLICQIISNLSGDTTHSKKRAHHTLYYSEEHQGFMQDFLAAVGIPFDNTKGVKNTIDPSSWMNLTFRAEGVPSENKKFTNIENFIPKS